AQAARLDAMGLVQDVSGLMRRTVQRFGGVPSVTKPLYVVAGGWLAVPQYQRLVGHQIGEPVLRLAGIDPDGKIDYPTLRRALSDISKTTPDRRGVPVVASPRPWGIGAAETPDVDAWCWGVIHAWGGGLADRHGERVALASPETVAALEWLAATLSERPWRDAVHPEAGSWTDAEKNAAFVSGATAYTFTEQALVPTESRSPGTGEGDSRADAVYLRTPAGPVERPRAIGGGAAWFLPRGAPPEPVERLLEALLEPTIQRRLWQAGGGFALPAYLAGWDDPVLASLPDFRNAQRFRNELTNGGFLSATGNSGPETAASQAIGDAGLGIGMLRAVLAGRPAREVVAEAQQQATQLFRDYGLPGV
ncbi:MAG: hypothetical protein ACRDI2_03455, partial [Chloroflexota bacterium]